MTAHVSATAASVTPADIAARWPFRVADRAEIVRMLIGPEYWRRAFSRDTAHSWLTRADNAAKVRALIWRILFTRTAFGSRPTRYEVASVSVAWPDEPPPAEGKVWEAAQAPLQRSEIPDWAAPLLDLFDALTPAAGGRP